MTLLLQYRYREGGSVGFPGAPLVDVDVDGAGAGAGAVDADADAYAVKTFSWTMESSVMSQFKRVRK